MKRKLLLLVLFLLVLLLLLLLLLLFLLLLKDTHKISGSSELKHEEKRLEVDSMRFRQSVIAEGNGFNE